MTIPIAEIFGPTVQGEGAVIGSKTMFIRVTGCDFSCFWCDSKFAWAMGNSVDMAAQEIFDRVLWQGGLNFDTVTITGGNPAMISDEMRQLIDLFHEEGIHVALETQGSIWQDWMHDCDITAISPKPPSSGQPFDEVVLKKIARHLEGDAWFVKVVVFDDEDYEFAKKVFDLVRPYKAQLFLQVGNIMIRNEDLAEQRKALLEKLDWLIQKVLMEPRMNNVVVLPQLHTLLYGNRQGV